MMPKHSSRAPWGRRLTAMVAVSLLTLGACSDSDSGVGPSTIEVVEIVTLPNNQTLTNLVPGNTRQMLAAPTNSKGNWIDRPVTWSSTNPAAATITEAGLVTAVAGGSTYIRATAGGKTDSIAIGVRYPVGTINITPATTTLRREGAVQLTATTLDTQGATVTGRPVTWTTSNAAVATVSATGLVAAQAAPVDGSTATITATTLNASDGGTVITATRVITINGDAVVGTVTVTGGSGFHGSAGTINLTAVARSGLGNTIPAPITWSTNNPAIATVNASGTVSFVGGAGNLTVTATAEGAGANGANVAGTTTFNVVTALVPGATITVPDFSEGTFAEYAVSGAQSFEIFTTGGTGDVDMYLFAPGVTPVAINNGFSGWVCRPWAIGSTETCTVASPVAGWYRVRFWAYVGDGNVSGLTVRLTSPLP